MEGPTRSSCGRDGLVADEEVEVLGSALPREMAGRASSAGKKRGFVGDGGAAGTCAATGRGTLGRNRCRENERGRVVSGEA